MNTSSLSPIGHSPARHADRAARRPRNFPRTDYHFQIHAEDVATARETRVAATRADVRAFRKLSSDYIADGSGRGHLVEMGVYALVTGLIAWPLVSLLIVLAQTARG